MKYMVKLFDKYGPATIFLFALTPLPDDLLFIPLGVMRYPFWKAFIPALFGKMLDDIHFGCTAVNSQSN